jgi:cell division protein FtsZ
MPQVKPEVEAFARIKVIGCGGSGKNATNHMINSKVRGVDFIAVNTDSQDLHNSLSKKKIHIGKNLTRGLGTGMNPELGKRAAEETKEEVQNSLKGADMVFIACGMGGGTGSGSAPVIAQVAKDLGILTVAVVTKPFSFEGTQRNKIADNGLSELKKSVDALIVIPNDRLLQTVSRDTSAQNAFAMCDEVLKQAVEGISDLITTPGIINIDFADIRAVMENAGPALMGVGVATGEKRAEDAARLAINSPLLDISINGAKGVLFSIAGGDDLGMLEIQDAAKIITESIDPEAKVIFGTVRDDRLKKGSVKVTVIASGFPEPSVYKPSSSNSLLSFQRGDFTPTQQTTREEAPRGRIYNTQEPITAPIAQSFSATEIQINRVEVETEPEVVSVSNDESKKIIIDDTQDDDWGAVPAFLRRSKLK